MKIIAIIPARGNSKSINKKNLIKFSGKPLIYWSIKQALDTKQISDVYVTSDNDDILKFSQQYGAKTIKDQKFYLEITQHLKVLFLHYVK